MLHDGTENDRTGEPWQIVGTCFALGIVQTMKFQGILGALDKGSTDQTAGNWCFLTPNHPFCPSVLTFFPNHPLYTSVMLEGSKCTEVP